MVKKACYQGFLPAAVFGIAAGILADILLVLFLRRIAVLAALRTKILGQFTAVFRIFAQQRNHLGRGITLFRKFDQGFAGDFLRFSSAPRSSSNFTNEVERLCTAPASGVDPS